MSPSEFVEFFDGRAAGALLVEAGKPGGVGLIGLKDAAGFEKMIQAKAPKDPTTETVAGLKFSIGPEGQCYASDKTWVYLADSKASAELLVAAVAGKETLAAVPAFVEAKAKVAGDGSLMVLYWDIAATVKEVQSSKLPFTDASTFKDLACLEYAVSNMNLRGQLCDSFLKVKNDKSTLASKLLTKGSVTPASFGALTKVASTGQAIDLEWTFNSLVAIAMLIPESRQNAGMASMGLAVYGNPFGAFEGEIATTNNGLDQAGSTLAANFGSARAQGQMTACSSNLKNLGTAVEMYSTDWSGRYPTSVNSLTPNYLRTIPKCPAAGSDTYSSTYKMSAGPDRFEFACSGNHHQQATENVPSYSSEVGLIAGKSINSEADSSLTPSLAVTAGVKDVKLAHAMLAKILPNVGDEPKVGEEKDYGLPGASLKMKTSAPPRLFFSFGDKAAALLDTKGGTLADQPRLKDALAWGGDGIVYADYMNLETMIEGIEKVIPSDGSEESELAKVLVSKIKKCDLEGASCLAVRPDGLHWRAFGSGGGMVAIGAVGGAILVPNFIRARSQGQLTACKSNLKNIATAMEMYATDNSGHYPSSMNQLTPEYLVTIPECSAAGSVTYRAYFGAKAKGNSQNFPDYFYLECAGHHHQALEVPADYPAYNSMEGLLESSL